MSKKRKILIAVGLVIAIAVLGGLSMASTRDRGIEVRTEPVARRDLVSVVTASGFIQPKRKVDISADVSGRVIELPIEEGQWVNQGDLLLRIDASAYQAAARRAEAGVASAKANAAQARAHYLQAKSALERAEKLSSGQAGLISAEQLEQARTQAAVSEAQYEAARYGVSQAQAGLSETREALRKTTIVAPMSGRITRLNIDEGETAIIGTMNNPGSLLLTIADLSVMEATVKVDETDVPHISVGDSATVRIDAFPGQSFAGHVTRISHSAATAQAAQMGGQAAQSVDFEVVVTLKDPPESLRPDLSATADVITDVRNDVVAVPIIAVTVRDPEGKKFDLGDDEKEQGPPVSREDQKEVEGVFVVEEGKAKFVPVEVGITGERYFEITAGLSGGEVVVSGSYQAIRDLETGAALKLPAAPSDKGAAAKGAGSDDAKEK